MIPMTFFAPEKCAGGLERLGGYRQRWVMALAASHGGPLHDEDIHGADALGTVAANRGGGAAVRRPGRQGRRWRWAGWARGCEN